jgi:hypothetical protein
MTPDDFRRLALSLNGAKEGSHMGAADFRVGGRIFATLASEKQGYGNLMLTPELQADFVGERPDLFCLWQVAGAGWARLTYISCKRTRTHWPVRLSPRGNCASRRTPTQEVPFRAAQKIETLDPICWACLPLRGRACAPLPKCSRAHSSPRGKRIRKLALRSGAYKARRTTAYSTCRGLPQ